MFVLRQINHVLVKKRKKNHVLISQRKLKESRRCRADRTEDDMHACRSM